MPLHSPQGAPSQLRLNPERVAYWYLRLNGFLLLENFIVHDFRSGSQRTDADLIGARFRHRQEFAIDSETPMRDDAEHLHVSDDFDDVVIAEVKTNQPCTLNGPWTNPQRQNMPRVLSAIGCLPPQAVQDAAECLYGRGMAVCGNLRIRLVAIGRELNPGLLEQYPDVTQLTWDEILTFIWRRFGVYRNQKRDVQQWTSSGRALQRLANTHRQNVNLFIAESKRAMAVQHDGGA